MRIGIDGRKIRDYGIGTYIRGLLHGLASIPTDEQYVVFVPSDAVGLVPSRFETVIHNVRSHTPIEMFTLALAIDRARLDLFHAPHFIIPFSGCASVVTLHDAIPFHYRYSVPFATEYTRMMTRRAAEQAWRILTVSEAAKADLVTTVRCDPRKIVVTYNGIDESFRHEDPERDSSDRRYFLYVGNRGPHKNVEGLVEAFRRLRGRSSGVRLVLAGIPRDAVRPEEGVELAGFVSEEELRSLYRGARALVMPSFIEGFGLPAVEAMACGTAVITSTAPALVEVTGDAALHVDPRSVDALTEAMARVDSDEELRRRMREAGRERARAFTWRRCAEQTRTVYRSFRST